MTTITSIMRGSDIGATKACEVAKPWELQLKGLLLAGKKIYPKKKSIIQKNKKTSTNSYKYSEEMKKTKNYY